MSSNSELQSVSGSLVHVNRRHRRGALKTQGSRGGVGGAAEGKSKKEA